MKFEKFTNDQLQCFRPSSTASSELGALGVCAPSAPICWFERRILAKRFLESLIIYDRGVSREGCVRVSSFRPRFCEPTSVISGLSAKTLPCRPFVLRARRSFCFGLVGDQSALVGRCSVGEPSRVGSADTCLVAGVGGKYRL